MRNSALRYAPHLGYMSPTPLFARSVGSDDPHAQARFASEHGFSGLFHPWVGSRSPEEIARFKESLETFGLQAGTIAYASYEEIVAPRWVSRRTEDREVLLRNVENSARLARELGAETLAVLIASNDEDGKLTQMANVRENLSYAADVAERYQVVLGIEPLVALPGMLFQSTYTAAEVIDLVNRPAVRLIFDTGHVASMDGSVLDVQASVERLVCVYQLADMPGRTEPGTGELDFPAFLSRLINSGYRGLVELEHGWTSDTAETEAAGIALLEQIDKEAARLARGQAG